MMVPIQVIRWYRMQCYDGTDSCATVVPIRRYCHMVQTSETIRKDNPQKALQEEDEVTARAKAAFAEIRAMAERGEFPEMTLDEINEEIREVRRLRKERNHS